MNKIRVFIICSGLGQVMRGYESFTRECFDALKNEPDLDLYLYKGGGSSGQQEKVLFNLYRLHPITKLIAGLLNMRTYTIEQITFFLSLIPHILIKKPDLIFLSDFECGTFLWHFREKLKLNYKLLFSNGAPNGPPFHRFDHVQQLLKANYALAISGGEPAAKHTIVPYGINTVQTGRLLDLSTKNKLRAELGIPQNRKVLISVGAVNPHHKRMDYLVREVAKVKKTENPYLLILGQLDESSAPIVTLAHDLLGRENVRIQTVDFAGIHEYYRLADYFVLCSLQEGFGRVFLEALSYGLPVLAHDYAVSREVLGEYGYFADFTREGALAELLIQLLPVIQTTDTQKQRQMYVFENYSWEKLKTTYLTLVKTCLAQSQPAAIFELST